MSYQVLRKVLSKGNHSLQWVNNECLIFGNVICKLPPMVTGGIRVLTCLSDVVNQPILGTLRTKHSIAIVFFPVIYL